jgi:hypothetical protein
MKVLKKLPLCEKITHVKSYLNVLNGNQDIDNSISLVFLTVHGYLMIYGDSFAFQHKVTSSSLMQSVIFLLLSEVLFILSCVRPNKCNNLKIRIFKKN